MQHTFEIKRIITAAACLLAVTLCTSSCSVWNWMWEAETQATVNTEDLIVDESHDANGFRTAKYDREICHEGTDIYYANESDKGKRIIVIDAGHQEKANLDKESNGPGSDDMKTKVAQGATGVATGAFEYELNLQVALFLRDELYERGYSVVMIRETNTVNISNKERAEIANKYQAAAYIRIHANSYDDASVKGAETLCQSADNPYPACAAVYDESRALSEAVLNSFCVATSRRSRGVKETDTMTGINWAAVPSTIVEMGFMSNPEEDRYMNEVYFRMRAAIGIADGIEAYFKALDDYHHRI